MNWPTAPRTVMLDAHTDGAAVLTLCCHTEVTLAECFTLANAGNEPWASHRIQCPQATFKACHSPSRTLIHSCPSHVVVDRWLERCGFNKHRTVPSAMCRLRIIEAMDPVLTNNVLYESWCRMHMFGDAVSRSCLCSLVGFRPVLRQCRSRWPQLVGDLPQPAPQQLHPSH